MQDVPLFFIETHRYTVLQEVTDVVMICVRHTTELTCRVLVAASGWTGRRRAVQQKAAQELNTPLPRQNSVKYKYIRLPDKVQEAGGV